MGDLTTGSGPSHHFDDNCKLKRRLLRRRKKKEKARPKKPRGPEYIFVHFNAWEYASSDELWAGLVRNMYEKVELRIRKQSMRQNHAGEDVPTTTNFKKQWMK